VDIHETADGLILLFALPGVAAEDIEVRLERTALTVSALRRVRLAERGALIRRLEIPHGRFVREIALSGPGIEAAHRAAAVACGCCPHCAHPQRVALPWCGHAHHHRSRAEHRCGTGGGAGGEQDCAARA